MSTNRGNRRPDKARELMGRLIPKQQIINKPVTLNSCLGTTRPKTRQAPRPEKMTILPPLSPKKATVMVNEDHSDELIPSCFTDPYDFIKDIKQRNDWQSYVYLYPANILEDADHPTRLRIIPPGEANREEFWTLSMKGLSHIKGGEVDFIPLDEWLRSNELFTRVWQLPFFKHQRQWRHFRLWKSMVHGSKMKNAQKSLSSNLFVADAILRPAFTSIQRKINDLSTIKLFSIGSDGTYTMQRFLDENRAHRDRVNKTFDDFSRYVLKVVVEACEQLKDALNLPDRRHTKNNKGPLDEMIEQYNKQKYQGVTTTLDQNVNREFTKRAAYREVCLKITRFIRLIDYLVISFLRTTCFNSLLEMFSIFESLHERGVKRFSFNDAENQESLELDLPFEYQRYYSILKQKTSEMFEMPIFKITLAFDGTLSWEPQEVDVTERIDLVRNEFIDILFKVPRLLANPLFGNYFLSSEFGDDGQNKVSLPDLGQIIFNDRVYKETTKNTARLIRHAFSLLQYYSKTFDDAVEIYNDNKGFDIKFIDDIKIVAQDIRKKINQLRDQEHMLRTIQSKSNVGIFSVFTGPMKQVLVRSPSICLSQIQQQLPNVTRRNLDIFNKNVRDAYNELSIVPNNVQTYVDYLNAVERYTEGVKQLTIQQETISEFYNLAAEQNIPILESEIESFNELIPILENVKLYMSQSENTKADYTPKFSRMLDDNTDALHQRVKGVLELAANPKLGDIKTTCNEAAKILVVLIARANEVLYMSDELNGYSRTMGRPKMKFEDVAELTKDVGLKTLLWETKTLWEQLAAKWFDMNFSQVDTDVLVSEIQEYKLRALRANKGLVDNVVADQLCTSINDFSNLMPIITDLKNPALTNDHKTMIQNILGSPIFQADGFKFQDLFNIHAFNFVDQIHAISKQATNERKLHEAISKVSKTLDELSFSVASSKTIKNAYVLSEFNPIINKLDECHAIIEAVRASHYVAPLRTIAEQWSKQVKTLTSCVRKLMHVQEEWTTMSLIYPNNIRPNPQDFKEITYVEKVWRTISSKINDDPSVAKISLANQTIPDLDQATESLSRLRRSLYTELNTKRSVFPRLYFLSDNKFTNMIAHSKEPTCILPYLINLFSSVTDVKIEIENHAPCATAVFNKSGEKVELRPIKFRTNVESWLLQLDEAIKRSIRRDMILASEHQQELTREDWIGSELSQLSVILTRLEWTSRVNLCFQAHNVANSLGILLTETRQLIQNMNAIMNTDIAAIDRLKVAANLALYIYQRDTVQNLIKCRAFTEDNYLWYRTLKYSWGQNKVIQVSIGNLTLDYGYEFSDCSERMVMTDISDRVFTSICSAFKKMRGSIIVGDSGVGKDECIKELSYMFGRFCFFMSCNDLTTISHITNVFKGGALSDVWVCFKNIGNSRTEVVSVLSDYLRALKQAEESEIKKFEIAGTEINLTYNCGFFTTQDNSETPVPESLRVYFRPVAILEPPIQKACEALLWIQGFSDPIAISEKVAQMLKALASAFEGYPYSFGLVTMKFILSHIQQFKNASNQLSDLQIISASTKAALKKMMTNKDAKAMREIVKLYFPNCEIDKEVKYRAYFYEEIKNVCEKLKFAPDPELIKRAFQIHENLSIMRSIILCGDSCSGKTTALRIIREYYQKEIKTEEQKEVKVNVVCPAAFSPNELFGRVRPITREFINGLVPNIVESISEDDSNCKRWFIFDGPFTNSWVDYFSSSLIDGIPFETERGEKLEIPSKMKFIFETTDISMATPALIGKCGLISFEYRSQGWQPYVDTVKTNKIYPHFKENEFLKDKFNDLVDASFYQGIAFLAENGSPNHGIVPLSLISNFFKIFEELIKDLDLSAKTAENTNIMSSLFIFSYIWAFGGHLDYGRRQIFDSVARDSFGHQANMPNRGLLFDWRYDITTKTFINWSESALRFMKVADESFEVNPQQINLERVIVPTAETERVKYLLNLMHSLKGNIIIRGPRGGGKSVLVQEFLRSQEEKNNLTLIDGTVTKSTQRQDLIKAISKQLMTKKNVLYPKANLPCTVYIEDFDQAPVNEYGARPIHEAFIEILHHGGLNLSIKDEWHRVKGISLLAIANDDTGSEALISSRFSRCAFNLEITPPDSGNIFFIIHSILQLFFRGYNESVQSIVPKLLSATIYVYENLVSIYPSVPSKPHYIFNNHDLMKVCYGMMRATPEVIQDDKSLERLWFHEMNRCFMDKLIPNDRQRYMDQMTLALKNKTSSNQAITIDLYSVIYGHFISEAKENEDEDFMELNMNTPYCEFIETEDLVPVFERYISKYKIRKRGNTENLIMFNSAVHHIAHIHRIFKKPKGHALLLGPNGSTKRTTVKLAAFMAGYEVFEFTGAISFRDELKQIISKTINGIGVVILVSDIFVRKPEVMSDISMIMSGVGVHNIFTVQELDKICDDMVAYTRLNGTNESIQNLISTFSERVKQVVHFAVTMDPTDSDFGDLVREYPRFFSMSTIECFEEFPINNILHTVDEKLLRFVSTEDVVRKITAVTVSIFNKASDLSKDPSSKGHLKFFVSPSLYTKYIDVLIGQMTVIYASKNTKNNQLTAAFKLLEELKVKNEELDKASTSLTPEIQEKQKLLNDIEGQIKENSMKAEEIESVIKEEEAEVNRQLAEAEKMQKEQKDVLKDYVIDLDKAIAHLKVLSKSDLNELQAEKSPANHTIMEVVCILFEMDPTWPNSLSLLNDTLLINKLTTIYGTESIIQPPQLSLLQPYITQNPYFSKQECERSCTAAMYLYNWAMALISYTDAYNRLRPQTESIKNFSESVQHKQRKLTKRSSQQKVYGSMILDLKKEKDSTSKLIHDLSEECSEYIAKKGNYQKVQNSVENLIPEWEEELKILKHSSKNTIGEAILQATALVFFGPLPLAQRESLISYVREICASANISTPATFDLIKSLGRPRELSQWRQAGLSTDLYELQNAVLLTCAPLSPLVVDPDGHVTHAIKFVEEMNQLIITRTDNQSYQRSVEQAIRNGTAVLIEDVGNTISQGMHSVVARQFFSQEGKQLCRLGDRMIEYDERYKIYMSTMNESPDFANDVYSYATVIDFTPTQERLTDITVRQMLDSSGQDFSKQLDDVLTQQENDTRSLAASKQRILSLLSMSDQDTILDDNPLIEEMEKISQSIKQTAQKLETYTEKIVSLEMDRHVYVDAAKRVSVIFNMMNNLKSLDTLYTFGTPNFARAISNGVKSGSKIVESVTLEMHRALMRSVFPEHHLLVSFLFCAALMVSENKLKREEVELFVNNIPDEKGNFENPLPLLITAEQWAHVQTISKKVPAMKAMPGIIMSDVEGFGEFLKSGQIDLPPRYGKKLSQFQKILLFKVLLPQHIPALMQKYIRDNLGEEYATEQVCTVENAYEAASQKVPIFVMTADNVSPVIPIEQCAQTYGVRLRVLTIGPNRTDKLDTIFSSASSKGEWLLCQDIDNGDRELQNMFNNIIIRLSQAFAHSEFRLFFSAKSNSKVPLNLLQNSVRIAVSSETGTGSMVSRYLESVNPIIYERSRWTRTAYAITLFHVIATRRAWVTKHRIFASLYDFEDALNTLEIISDDFDRKWSVRDVAEATIGLCYEGSVTSKLNDAAFQATLSRIFNVEYIENGVCEAESFFFIPEDLTSESIAKQAQKLTLAPPAEAIGISASTAAEASASEQKFISKCLSYIAKNTQKFDILSKVQPILSKIVLAMPQLEEISAGNTNLGPHESPIMAVLIFEAKHLRETIAKVNSFIESVYSVLRGEKSVTVEIRKYCQMLCEGDVPKEWQVPRVPKRLPEWIPFIGKRAAFFNDWINRGNPYLFHADVFVRPRALINAIIMEHAKNTKQQPESLQLDAEISFAEPITEPPCGAWLSGLQLCGAAWDEESTSVIREGHPINFWVRIIPISDEEKSNSENSEKPPNFECPVFDSSFSKDAITAIPVFTKIPRDELSEREVRFEIK